MELRLTDEAPPRVLTTRVMELSPTHTLYMSHQPNQKDPTVLTSCINNQSYISCFPTHTQQSNISLSPQPHIIIKASSLKPSK